MRSSLLNRLKTQLKYRKSNYSEGSDSPEEPSEHASALSVQDQNPVANYYQQKLSTNLAVFSRFALQTRSLVIRDVFARAASRGQQSLGDLLSVIESHMCPNDPQADLSDLVRYYDTEILLALADLLANTARNDLDTHAALQVYDMVYSAEGSSAFQDHHKLQYVEALAEAGRFDDMEKLASDFSIGELAPLQDELLNIQKIRRIGASANEWLDAMNDLYDSIQMSPIRLSNDDTLPLLDRLESDASNRVDGPKVSVIMPTYSPGPGIQTAIRSLLEQTWHNIEIIIVDDASPEEFQDRFSALEDLDPRIRLVRQEYNAGAYVARNTGLSLASGEYIMAHDDDDWSHPDKIALQASILAEDENMVATSSAHIRLTEDMDFQRVNVHARYMQMNYSSLMFRKSIIDQIGPWDTVNRGGDSEFLTRVIENFGSQRMADLMENPLSFSRVWAGSLTSGEMSRGFFAYSRLLYRWSFRQWHWERSRQGKKAVRRAGEPRPYAVPTTFEPGQRNRDLGLFDVIYVTDFFRQARFVRFVMNEMDSLQKQGYRVGFMHLNSPQTDRPAGFPPDLFVQQRQGHVTQVAHDDIAETKLLVVYDASIGMFLDQVTSSVVSRRSIVIEHELPSLKNSKIRSASLKSLALEHLDSCFRTQFEIVGASIVEQEELRSQVPHRRLLSDQHVWHQHVTHDPGQIRPPGATPVIGFHSYGNRYRWPSSKDEFRRVYCSSNFETRFFGQLDDLIERFGVDIFEGKITEDTERLGPATFFDEIDFWVYYPHNRLQDRIWEPALSAMQAGKVVVMPERLEPLYGSAAVYAKAEDVSRVVDELSRTPTAYRAQALRGQKLISQYYSPHQFMGRVDSLLLNDGSH